MKVTMISRGVEISIAGGVAETEDVNYCDCFFFSFFFFESQLLIVSIGDNRHNCAKPHGPRYKGISTKHGPRSPKPPTTVHPATPKLKPSDPARQRNPRPVLSVKTTRR